MAASKLLIASIVVSLLLFGAHADAGAEDEVLNPPPSLSSKAAADDSRRLEVEQLRSRISDLEDNIADRVRELKIKEENTEYLQKIIYEKSENIVLLQDELVSIQGTVDVEEVEGKANERVGELEKQVQKLKSEIETQSRKRDALETQAGEADKKLQELNLKLENLQKTNGEQKRRIKKTERALKVAEEELMRAQLEATSKTRQLTEIHGAWLPPWLATHINSCQDLTASHWNAHAKPVLNAFLQKASEQSKVAQKWVQPHLETAKTKWIPAVKEQWVIFVTYVEPHVQLVSKKAIEFYEASKRSIAPHIAKVQEVADPYFQEVRKFSKPYIDQAALVTKPHVETVQVALKPYTKYVVRAYRKFLKSATTYHRQVQAIFMEKLNKHELTKPLATKKLDWFMASALLALPIFFVYRLLSIVFCKKARKPARNAHASHASRRHKRRHADK